MLKSYYYENKAIATGKASYRSQDHKENQIKNNHILCVWKNCESPTFSYKDNWKT